MVVGGEDAVDVGAGLAGRRQHLLRLHRVDGRRGLGDLVNNPSKVNKQDLKLTNGSLRRAKQQNKQRDIERYINRDGRGFRIRTGRHSCRPSRRPERSSSSASGSSLRRLDSVYLRARLLEQIPDGEEYKQEGRKEGERRRFRKGNSRFGWKTEGSSVSVNYCDHQAKSLPFFFFEKFYRSIDNHPQQYKETTKYYK